jgi:hypothetical protein
MEGPTHATSPQTLSQKQLDANRANAAKSTGPRTPQSKARSAQNARKHGFTASTFAIEEFDRLKALRQELPTEPIFDPQPEPQETT